MAATAVITFGGCAMAQPPHPTPPAPATLARAAQLLAAERIEVEVDYLVGCKPAAGTLYGIRAFLEAYVAPPGGVGVTLDEEIRAEAIGTARDGLDESVLWRVAREHRRRHQHGPTVSIQLLFVPRFGVASERPRRGVAFPADGFAVIASDAVRSEAFLTVRPDEVERFVVQHELGHLLGLVSDPRHEHDGHCTDPRCILYQGVDLRALLANWWRVFTGRLPETLDAACRRELQKRRASARADCATFPSAPSC